MEDKLDLIQKNLGEFLKASDEAQKNNQDALDDITKKMEEMQQKQFDLKKDQEDQFKSLDSRFSSLGKSQKNISNEEFSEYRKTLREFLSSKGQSAIVTDVNKKAIKAIVEKKVGWLDDENYKVKSYLESSNADGGYLVRPEMSSMFVGREYETSPIRQVANIATTSSDSMQFIIRDNLPSNGGWVKEGAIISNTDSQKFGTLEIKTHKLYANPVISEEMLSDPFVDIENIVMMDGQESLTLSENSSFIAGNGNGKPKGITSYKNWTGGTYTRDAIEQVNSGSNGEVTYDGLVDIQNSLLEAYQPNAVWLMHRTTYGAICKLKDNNGQPYVGGYGTYLRDGSSINVPMVLNKPVIFCSDMPVVANGALSVAYGDFRRGYTILDKLGMQITPNPYKYEGVVSYFMRKRVGAAVTNYQAIKLLKLSS